MSLDRVEVVELQKRAMRDWVRSVGASSPNAQAFDRDGVTAAIVPVCPKRSIANSVTYDDPAPLFEHLDEVGDRMDAAGIEAWTVWSPEFDHETIAGLEARGHKFDGKPAAMALELDGWEAPEIGDLDWDLDADGETLGRLNDRAYGLTGADGFAGSLATPPDDMRLHQAHVDGQVACVLGTIDHDSDIGFYFVATDPDHRGQGLASRLMSAALVDARKRGLRTSTLQASKLGEPVYRRLGFEPYFRFHMYERRQA